MAEITETEKSKLDIESDKLAIERQKLSLESEKIRLERLKTLWAGLAVIVPVLAAAIGVWSFLQQSKLQAQLQAQQAKYQAELQAQQAKSQFELKAVELVLNTGSPSEGKAKAKALANLFPDKLSDSFADSFYPQCYSSVEAQVTPDNRIAKKRSPKAPRGVVAPRPFSVNSETWKIPNVLERRRNLVSQSDVVPISPLLPKMQ